jgi:beta-mannosidase
VKNGLIYLFFFICSIAESQNQFYYSFYDKHWEFREVGTRKYYPAKVPGTVHLDLMSNGLIPNPYFESKEKSVQWVEEKDWEYVCEFQYGGKSYQHTELIFEGLDTYARVYLNGRLILKSKNMFTRYTIDVKKYLKNGNNKLKIVFESAVKHGKAEAKKLPYTLPGDEKVFTRKAQYQYGWDWGPRLVTAGIYKYPYLLAWNELKVNSCYHHVKSITDTLAEVYLIWETESDTSRKYRFLLALSSNKNYIRIDSTVNIKKGIHRDSLLLKIPNPQLWNCNGQGPVELYNYLFQIIEDKHYVVQVNGNFGLRTIELVKEKDAVGETFYFKVNGKPVFMKGANFIPPDNFVAQTAGKYYSDLIRKAKEANVNMLRVWGGGLYPDDEFYTLCDQNGILVWQDFMFACGMYPGDSAFLNSVKQEAEQQVVRLRNHPCLALWCGNNEIDEGWHNWGWQKQYNYSKTDSAKIWSDYQNLFHDILPNTVKAFDAKTPYVSSSPMLGWGKKESLLRGDSHYWGVWWGLEPFEVYEKKVGRFMSEYGFQGMPSYFTLKKYGDSLDLNSSYIKAHQKHPTGYQTINTYMERDYKVPTDFFKYVYTSQLLQRDGMQIAIETHRRNKPYCMGSLYWQWNDCWPVTSWSAIDFDHQPKALYYATKKLYANFSLSVNNANRKYNVYVISDSIKSINAKLELKLKNTKGQTLLTKVKNISVKENSSEVFESFSDEELKLFNKNDIYLSCHLMMNGKNVAHKNYFFAKPKELVLYKPTISIRQTDSSVSITSDVFVKDLYLFTEKGELLIPDNYFDLEPNESIEMKAYSGGIYLSEQIQYLSLYDINQ